MSLGTDKMGTEANPGSSMFAFSYTGFRSVVFESVVFETWPLVALEVLTVDPKLFI